MNNKEILCEIIWDPEDGHVVGLSNQNDGLYYGRMDISLFTSLFGQCPSKGKSLILTIPDPYVEIKNKE